GTFIYTEPAVINYDATSDSGSNGNFIPDVRMPGFPGTTGTTDNNSIEVLTYIEFPAAGLYTMGVNSDDGFRVSAAVVPADVQSRITLGQFDAGRGAADTLF